MAINQANPNRKQSGGRFKKQKVRRQHEQGRAASLTRVGDEKMQRIRTLGGNAKHRALAKRQAHVVNPKTGKHQTVEILNVADNEANRHFIRRNIITKGAIIETDAGKARVTSRPGQTGIVQAVLQ